MPGKQVSQKTIVEMMRALREYGTASNDLERPPNFTELLYEIDLPDWFVTHAKDFYRWNWTRILMELRNGRFFVNPYSNSLTSITGKYLADYEKERLGEDLIQRLAALAGTLPTGESVLLSLHLDGFDVDQAKLALVPLEGPVSAREEEDHLTRLVRGSGLPDITTVLKHIADAQSLYSDGKNHPSLNESRSLIQALIDGISTETDAHGAHSTQLPGGTGPRIEFLTKVGFFTLDEQAAFNSAWGSLSAGSHPGVPEREQARIGLVLALEFGQLLLLKFANWKANANRKFS